MLLVLNQRPFGSCRSTCTVQKEAAELIGGQILLSVGHMIKYDTDSTTLCYFITVPARTSYFLITFSVSVFIECK